MVLILKRADQMKQLLSFAGLGSHGDELQHQFVQIARQKRFQTVAYGCFVTTDDECSR
jgi:hypothetical protein